MLRSFFIAIFHQFTSFVELGFLLFSEFHFHSEAMSLHVRLKTQLFHQRFCGFFVAGFEKLMGLNQFLKGFLVDLVLVFFSHRRL